MTRICTIVCAASVSIGAIAKPVAAQNLRLAVFGAAGFGSLYRMEDQNFGTKLNLGGGGGIDWKRLALDAEIHRTLGLEPRRVECGIVGATCIGSAREGFLEATMLSANVSYHFGHTRVRPYVMGSVGVLWTEGVSSLTIAGDTVATVSELHESDAGLALGVGFGVDISITPAVSVRPEFRTYSSVAMSRVNVGLHRGAVGVRYRWRGAAATHPDAR